MTSDVDTKKMDIDVFIQGESPKRKEIIFIRIGVLHANSPRKIEMQKNSDGQMIVTPSQLNGLQIKQMSIRQCVEQSKWNYLFKKEEEGGKNDDDNDNDDEDDDEDTDDDNKINASSTTTSNTKRKYNTITPGDIEDMAKSDMAKPYPHLLQALRVGEDGFNPTNPSIQKSVFSLISELNDLLSTTYQLDVSGLRCIRC